MDQMVQIAAPKNEMLHAAEQLFLDDPTGRRVVVRNPHTWRPPTDLYETEDAFIARIEVAGMKQGHLSVSIADRLLTISGVRANSGPRGAYHQMEIQYGEFRTQVRLPASVDEERIEASYADGFLNVVMPKQGAYQVKVVSQIAGRETEGES